MISITETKKIKEFRDPSYIHESLFVGYLWSNPNLYQKYKSHKIVKATFTKGVWFFYFYIGQEMFNSGVREFDDKTVYSFLTSKPKEKGKKSWFDRYNEFNGFNTISELMEECKKDSSNDDYHFSEIQKYETLRLFEKEKLIDPQSKSLIKKLCDMTLIQVKMYMQHKFNSLFSHVNHGEVVEYDLFDEKLIDETIEEMDQGEVMGLPLHDASRLNKKIKGWKKGNLTYLVLATGVGKTSFSTDKFILGLIDQMLETGEKGLMFCNEENVKKFIRLILATIASTILKTPINREKMTEGNFNDKTKEKLQNAKQWLIKNNPDMIKFFYLKKYRLEDIITRINMYRPLGYEYVFVDTFKPDVSSKETARWEAFSNNAQDLHDAIKEDTNNCATLATVQLKIGKEYRYLDSSVVGKSGEIQEVAAVVLAGRMVYEDEYPGGRKELQPYNYDKDEFSGEWYKKPYQLDKNKQYMVLFFVKNREGESEEQIIYEANYGINSWREVAYVVVPRTSDNYR